jgi:hypothetical protein
MTYIGYKQTNLVNVLSIPTNSEDFRQFLNIRC